MSLSACDICATPTPESDLLFSERGRICATCELDLGDADSAQTQRRAIAFAGPILSFTAFILAASSILPVLGLLAAAAGPFVAIAAIGLGVKAMLTAGDAEGSDRTLLVLCGGITVSTAAIALCLSLLMLFSHLVVLSAGGPF